jgi:uncharacterized protein (TIGR02145 family)
MLAQAPNANYDPDWDGDGNLGVSDLLGFLGLFGDFDTDGDGVWDSVDQCLDMDACNFDSNPTVPCTFFVDAAGVCGGWCESDENGDGICDFTCGVDSVEYYGYSYATAQIEEQCWFAENLRTEIYRNGDSISANLTRQEWALTNSGAQTAYGLDEYSACTECDSTDPTTFGRLYNWYSVDDYRKVCPIGWHVPDIYEFQNLFSTVGGEAVAGLNLKSSPNDNPPWDGENNWGFSGIPGGYRDSNGNYYNGGFMGVFWASSESGSGAHWLRLHQGWFEAHILGNNAGLRTGMSVRCIKD